MRMIGTHPITELDKINNLFKTIIMTDPMLYLTGLIETNDLGGIVSLFYKHDTLFEEYPDEIRAAMNKCRNDAIRNLLSEGLETKKVEM